MNRSFKRIILIWIAVWLIVDALIIVKNHFTDYEREISVITSENLENYLKYNFISSLKTNGLPLKINGSGKNAYYSYPAGYGKVWLQEQLSDEIKRVGATAEINWNSKNSGFEITLNNEDINNYKLLFKKNGRLGSGLIAIIIDDFGYFWDERVDNLMEMEIPMAFAVIPGHEHSENIAYEALNKQKEVLVHLPMEPMNKQGRDEIILLKGKMSENEMRKLIEKSLKDVPGASGINNHQGSKMTGDEKGFKRFLAVIRPLNLYFIDSVTHASSIAYKEALEMGVPASRRTIFLDDSDDIKTIEYRLNELKQRARDEGWAIGIGHVNTNTISALKNEIPSMIEEGFQFVYPSQLVN